MLTDEQAEAIVRSANKWTTAVAVTMSEKNACRAGAAWQREEDARIARMTRQDHAAQGFYDGTEAVFAAIRRAGEPS